MLCAWLGACSRGTPPPGEQAGEPPIAVRIATVEQATLRERGEYLATLRSRKQVQVQPQIDGQVTQIFVAAGARVSPGEALLQIDPARQASLVSSEARTRQARQASLRFLAEQAQRLQALYEGGAVSKQEMLQAKAAHESARAEVAALGAQVKHQTVQLRYYRVTAPIGGVLGDIPVRVGDRVTPATLLTTIDSGTALEAYISLPVERAASARLDAPVELLDASDVVQVRTRVSFIAPSASEDTQGVLVKALLSEADTAGAGAASAKDRDEPGDDKPATAGSAAVEARPVLRPGQVLRARLTFSEYKGPVVPVVSVLRIAGQPFVFVVEGQGSELRARQRPITTGELVGAADTAEGQAATEARPDRYEVRSGLKVGERIVLSGIQKLHDGSPVTVEPEAGAAGKDKDKDRGKAGGGSR
ncbi:MAG: efflux RND transporter periplasmic adaptor subunit [Polyangia bacterium]